MATHGPNYSRPLPDLIEGEEEYEVEKVVNHRYAGRARTLQYLIKWIGYPEADNTWEPAEQIHAPIGTERLPRRKHAPYGAPWHHRCDGRDRQKDK